MDLIVNGKPGDFSGRSVSDLLAELKLKDDSIAVEVNGSIIHRNEYDEKTLSQGDIIEIVKFVGGG